MTTNLHNPYDVVMKRMVEADPVGLLRLVGLDGESAQPFNAEMSTISPQADYVLKVTNPDYLAHVEFVSTYKADAGRKMLLYAAIAHYNHVLPVESAIVLLRQSADGDAMTGEVWYGENVHRYRVIRLWEISPETILSGHAALLPLAPLTNIETAGLPDMVRRLGERFGELESPGDLWAETMVLMGLRVDAAQARELLKGVIRNMRDSSTYQAILQEGKTEGKAEGLAEGLAKGLAEGLTEGERRILLRNGIRRFGVPPASVQAVLNAITSPDEFERLADRLFDVQTWDDLLR